MHAEVASIPRESRRVLGGAAALAFKMERATAGSFSTHDGSAPRTTKSIGQVGAVMCGRWRVSGSGPRAGEGRRKTRGVP